MSSDQLEDLKQFVAATVSQSEARLDDRFDRLERRADCLEEKVGSGFAAIGDAIQDIYNRLDGQKSRA